MTAISFGPMKSRAAKLEMHLLSIDRLFEFLGQSTAISTLRGQPACPARLDQIQAGADFCSFPSSLKVACTRPQSSDRIAASMKCCAAQRPFFDKERAQAGLRRPETSFLAGRTRANHNHLILIVHKQIIGVIEPDDGSLPKLTLVPAKWMHSPRLVNLDPLIALSVGRGSREERVLWFSNRNRTRARTRTRPRSEKMD